MKNLSENKIYTYGTIVLDDLKESISSLILNQSNKDSLCLDEIVDAIYADDQNKKEIVKEIIRDIVEHKKYQKWDSKMLEASFLIKYSSSSSYYKLYTLLNKKIPSPATIESHYRKEIIEREKLLVNTKNVTKLLNHYWEDIKYKVQEYINEFNEAYSANIDINNFKIPICLGCDAASFTTFTEKLKQKETNNKKSNAEKKSRKKLKILFIKN